jgi:hypothetical protein
LDIAIPKLYPPLTPTGRSRRDVRNVRGLCALFIDLLKAHGQELAEKDRNAYRNRRSRRSRGLFSACCSPGQAENVGALARGAHLRAIAEHGLIAEGPRGTFSDPMPRNVPCPGKRVAHITGVSADHLPGVLNFFTHSSRSLGGAPLHGAAPLPGPGAPRAVDHLYWLTTGMERRCSVPQPTPPQVRSCSRRARIAAYAGLLWPLGATLGQWHKPTWASRCPSACPWAGRVSQPVGNLAGVIGSWLARAVC